MYALPMLVTSQPQSLGAQEAFAAADDGALLVDLRAVDPYLEVHIPGSILLVYEAGPGMASRARDCLPLDVPIVLLDLGAGDVDDAAASLRGKGFAVIGKVDDGINQWARLRGAPVSTEVVRGNQPPRHAAAESELKILDVGDPGAGTIQGATHIPIELLWRRVDEVHAARVVIASGYGVRAALAVGILERAGIKDIVFWKP